MVASISIVEFAWWFLIFRRQIYLNSRQLLEYLDLLVTSLEKMIISDKTNVTQRDTLNCQDEQRLK